MEFPNRFTTLANGLDVIAIQRPGARTAMLNVDVHVGARYEAPEDSGLSHLLEHMLFQGSERHGAPVRINRLAESLGAALNGCTSRDATRIEHWVSADRLEESARLVAGLLEAPRFEELETERQIVIEEALEEFDETGRRTDPETLSRRAAWPECPLGHPIVGEIEALERFELADLKRHHAKHYGAANMLLTVVGPAEPARLLAAVEGPFSRLPTGIRTPPAPAVISAGPVVVRVDDTGSQCECRLLFHTPGRTSPLAHALSVSRLVLDDGMASRLHQRLGAELGLAYDQWAMWEGYPDAGLFEFGALVSPDKVETFFTEAYTLAQELSQRPPRGEELERLRFRIRWAFESAMESPDGLINAFSQPRFYDEELTHPERLLETLLAVTPEEIAGAAEAVFRPDGAVLTCVGPMNKATRRALRALPRRWGASGS